VSITHTDLGRLDCSELALLIHLDAIFLHALMHCFNHIRHLTRSRLPICRAAFSTSSKPDVIVLGAGHNGLVAATLLARQGLKVSVSSLALKPLFSTVTQGRNQLNHRLRCMKPKTLLVEPARLSTLLAMHLVLAHQLVMHHTTADVWAGANSQLLKMLPCCALQELICWELCRLSC